jgi:homoaconitase/3-isopropylmalate dehydratase large subunit
MSMTITETIRAAHCGREPVEPGEFIRARVDMAMGNDLSAGGAVGVLRKIGAARVWDPDRIAPYRGHRRGGRCQRRGGRARGARGGRGRVRAVAAGGAP